MLIPIKWLKEYVKTNMPDDKIAETLTLAGLTIEEINNGVMDGEVTANRPDWLSIYGVARELAALTDSQLVELEETNLNLSDNTIIEIQSEPDLILRYTGTIIKNLKIGESPEWLKDRLKSVGIRSINNVVDVTNYIMVETGQPLHSFDIDKIHGKVTIRRGNKGEVIKTLDQVERKIDSDVIVAENNNQLIDLIGIMGGALSDTTSQTKNIFLQAAVFPPSLIRKSSKTVKLSTEASYRYERGVDYNNNKKYLMRASKMIIDFCGGEISGIIDNNPSKDISEPIQWNLNQAEALLGIKTSKEKALKWLNSLGIKTDFKDDTFSSTSPPWRFDINIKEDIFEEIARFSLINNLPRTQLRPRQAQKIISLYKKVEFTKDQLVNLSLSEIDGYSFLSAKNIKDSKLKIEDCLEASNPLSEEFQFLRPSLLPDCLMAVAQNPLFSPIAMFEIGNVFKKENEETNLGIILADNKKGVENLKNNIVAWLSKLNIQSEFIKIEKEILDKFKIRKSLVYFLEIQFSQIARSLDHKEIKFVIPKMNQSYTPISKFPAVKRDLAIIVSQNIAPVNIIRTIVEQSPNDTEILCELFDEFISDRFGTDKKSLAFHLLYQPKQKTLTDKDADILHQKIISALREIHKAEPRI